MSGTILTQPKGAKLIIVMAFDREGASELRSAFDPMELPSEELAICSAKVLATEHADVIAWSWEARPDSCEYGEARTLFRSGKVPDMESRAVNEELVKILIRYANAASCDDEFARVAALSSTLSGAIRSARNRKTLIRKIENRLQEFTNDNLPSLAIVKCLSILLEASAHNNTKEGIHLVKRLLAAAMEVEAAVLAETMLRLRPTAPGYFSVTILFRNTVLRQQIQSAHFARLAFHAKNDEAIVSLHARQLMQTGDIKAASDVLEEAADGIDGTGLSVSAELLFWQDRFEQAEQTANRALAESATLSGKERASLYLLKARCRIALADGDGARAALKQRNTEYPQASINVAESVFANICDGRFEEAYAYYWDGAPVKALATLGTPLIEREALEGASRLRIPLAGHCIIISIMGLGDEVRFAQMMPQIARLFDRVTLLCDRRIASILARSFPSVCVHGVDTGQPVPGIAPALATRIDAESFALLATADYVADLKQFAAVLRKSQRDIPSVGHHLQPLEGLVSKWQNWLEQLPEKSALGLFWRSSLPSHSARHKQVGLQDLLDALSGVNVKIVPLQYDLTREERDLIASNSRFAALPSDFDPKNNIEEMFGLLKALPLVVSLPGTTQHMGGAAGTPVLCPAHPYEASWRRAKGRKHEIWAPSVEVISGAPEDGLDGSIRIAVERLRQWLSHRAG
jgi:tetratricopeptide (TPR) repeat protein